MPISQSSFSLCCKHRLCLHILANKGNLYKDSKKAWYSVLILVPCHQLKNILYVARCCKVHVFSLLFCSCFWLNFFSGQMRVFYWLSSVRSSSLRDSLSLLNSSRLLLSICNIIRIHKQSLLLKRDVSEIFNLWFYMTGLLPGHFLLTDY